MRSKPQSPAEHIAQLQEVVAAHAVQKRFEVGQMVRRILCSLPQGLRDSNHLSIGAVMEIVPSMRALTGEYTDTAGEGLRIAIVDPDGGYAETLVEAWQYEIMQPDEIASMLGTTSH